MKTCHPVCSTSRFNRTHIVAIAKRFSNVAALFALFAIAAHLGTLTQPTCAVAGEIDYAFTYSDPFGVQAHGTLVSSNVPSDIAGNPGGAGYLVTSGSITVTASQGGYENVPNIAVGTYPLQFFAGPGDGVVEADDIDNLVYPGNNAGSGSYAGINSPSYIDTNGLVFGFPVGDPSNPNHEVQVGIYSYGGNDHNYALGWTPTGVRHDGEFSSPSILNNTGGGVFTLVVLPEPSSLTLLGLAGLACVGYGLRRRRTA
jgi:hypothetical protein